MEVESILQSGFPYHPEQDVGALPTYTLGSTSPTFGSSSLVIQPDGNITLSVTGTIRAAGLTPDELANVIAAIEIGKRLGPQATVVTLMVDSGLKYMSTDVFSKAEIG